tara:strand:- start:4846 stop:5100 length:255 start_codon:yes stop_codon:yes gene_type:complete
MSKIKEEELKSLQESQSKLNQIVNQMGVLSIQKVNIDKQEKSLLEQLSEVETKQLELKKELEEQYGKVSVNLEDGSYEEIPEDK